MVGKPEKVPNSSTWNYSICSSFACPKDLNTRTGINRVLACMVLKMDLGLHLAPNLT